MAEIKETFSRRRRSGFVSRWGVAAGLAVLLALAATRAGAQALTLDVRGSANPVTLGDNLTYKISVTNLYTFQVYNVFVTNAAPASSVFITADTTLGIVQSTGNPVVFNLGTLNPGDFALMTVTVRPVLAGQITDLATVITPTLPTLTTDSLVTQVLPQQADLAVSVAGPTGQVLANDWMTYRVTVTNQGPVTATGVIVSNNIPDGVGFIGLTPAGLNPIIANGSIVITLDSLTNQESRVFGLTVQPTNAGLVRFSATVTSDMLDTNLLDNVASTTVQVGAFATGSLIATNASPMIYNPQTGLMEQAIQLVNVGASNAPAARVIISGLTNQLYNAVGTNNGNPFVAYNSLLTPGTNVWLELEYFAPTRRPFAVPDSAYNAVAVNSNTPTVPSGTPFSVTLVTNLASGAIMIEFESVQGSSYTILYSDNVAFTSPLAAQPAVIAPANRVQWIDDGPPKTVSTPASTTARFYKVLLNQ
jgi:uncharacterized repeat protein (TIGR01451 family)